MTQKKSSAKPTPLANTDTSLEEVIRRVLAASIATAARLTEETKRIYLQNFEAWATMVRAGKIGNKNPPEPPMGYTVIKDEFGFSWPDRGTIAVCPMPEVPEDRTEPQVIERGEVDVLSIAANAYHQPGEMATGAWLIAHGAHPGEVGDPMSVWLKVHRATSFGIAKFYART